MLGLRYDCCSLETLNERSCLCCYCYTAIVVVVAVDDVAGAGAASAIRIDVNCAVAWTDMSCDVDFLNCVALQKEGTQLEYMYYKI